MILPHWVTDPTIDGIERSKRALAYRLRVAAAHHNVSANLRELSFACGYCGDYLTIAINRGKLSRRAELVVRQVMGAEVFPTEEELLAASH